MPGEHRPREARDTTTGRVIALDLEYATNLWTRFRGLMLRRELRAGHGLLIRPCSSIHMMWMRFPIDAVFVSASGRVTGVSRNVHPWWGFARGGRDTDAVLELRVGAAAGVEAGHQLDFS